MINAANLKKGALVLLGDGRTGIIVEKDQCPIKMDDIVNTGGYKIGVYVGHGITARGYLTMIDKVIRL